MTAIVSQRTDLDKTEMKGLISKDTLRRAGIVVSRVLERHDDECRRKKPLVRR